MYVTCPQCGANLDPGEKCDCTKSTAAKVIRNAAFSDAYQQEYTRTFSRMKRENLPTCIADDIAERAATKRAANVAGATVRSFHKIKRRKQA